MCLPLASTRYFSEKGEEKWTTGEAEEGEVRQKGGGVWGGSWQGAKEF